MLKCTFYSETYTTSNDVTGFRGTSDQPTPAEADTDDVNQETSEYTQSKVRDSDLLGNFYYNLLNIYHHHILTGLNENTNEEYGVSESKQIEEEDDEDEDDDDEEDEEGGKEEQDEEESTSKEISHQQVHKKKSSKGKHSLWSYSNSNFYIFI